MISRGMGADASLRLLIAQRQHSICRSPKLKGASFLKIFTLEEYLRPGDVINTFRGENRGAVSKLLHEGMGLDDITEGGNIHGCFISSGSGKKFNSGSSAASVMFFGQLRHTRTRLTKKTGAGGFMIASI